MRIVSIGGGPAGLYTAILMKRAMPDARITVHERNRPDDTFGFGVVFSDATLDNLASADPDTYEQIRRHFAHWDDIHIHRGGRVFRSTGHGFCGLERQTLLQLLQTRCADLGVELVFESQISDVEAVRKDADLVLAADGVGSAIRDRYAASFGPDVDMRPNRFVWLGTTFPFQAFTFYFKASKHGLFRIHAYRYREEGSTFIAECTADTYARAGFVEADEDATIAYLEELFADELAGHRLIKNRSIWRNFPNVRNRSWHHENVVLLGDAAHTAHFSIGSGTKLAMEDGIALRDALVAEASVPAALERYEATRRPSVESLQRAAQVSLEWFEGTERYMDLAPVQFAVSLMTRSLRVSHDNLAKRDGELVAEVDAWFAAQAGVTPRRPMLVPLSLGQLLLRNRVVCPAVTLPADDGAPSAAHLDHVGARADGGAGLILVGPAAVAADARASADALGLYEDQQVAGWTSLVERAHAGGAAVAAVLGHAGPAALSPIAASASELAGAASEDDLSCLPGDFAEAAGRAARAGVDLLVIDAAGDGLLATLCSPLSNRRSDRWGGSLAARSSALLAVVDAVHDAVPTMPIAVRMNASDHVEGGTDAIDAVARARLLRAAGIALVITSSGGLPGAGEVPTGRLAQVPLADQIRNEALLVTAAEATFGSGDDLDSVLCAGRADLCVLGELDAREPAFARTIADAAGVTL